MKLITYDNTNIIRFDTSDIIAASFGKFCGLQINELAMDLNAPSDATVSLDISLETQKNINTYLDYRRNCLAGFGELTSYEINYYDKLFLNTNYALPNEWRPTLYDITKNDQIDEFCCLGDHSELDISYRVIPNRGSSLFYRAVDARTDSVYLLVWLAPSHRVCLFNSNLKLERWAMTNHWTMVNLLANGLDAAYKVYLASWKKFEPIELKVQQRQARY